MGTVNLLTFCLFATLCNYSTASQLEWTTELKFPEGFKVRWFAEDKEYLVMEMEGQTKGWVAVGFSPNGGMKGSDIIMGWVDSNGKGHVKDLYAEDKTTPLVDVTQNVDLIDASEVDSYTKIRFRRRWTTCDEEQDSVINEDTVRLIWAMGDIDPNPDAGQEDFKPIYHGSRNRGVKSTFLQGKFHLINFPDEEESHLHPLYESGSIRNWDIRMPNVQVEGGITDTNYVCKLFKFPFDENVKHQIIGFRPLINIHNMKRVHHMNFFECSPPSSAGPSADIYDKYLDHPGAECYTENMPPEWGYCTSFPFTWAVGAEGFMLPEYGGYPLGERHNGTTYFMLEIHYDNPERARFTDDSGFRLFTTDDVRSKDFGGVTVNLRFGQFHVIPPGQKTWTNTAYCSSECTANTFPEEGITITQAHLHAHFAARKITLRHIRNGKELAPIAQDNHYDFNMQQTRVVNPPRKAYRGDILLVECEYDTLDRDKPTYGGTSTRDEMCEAIFFFYPRIPLSMCKIQVEYHDFLRPLGIEEVEGEDMLQILQLPYHPTPNQTLDPGDDAYSLVNSGRGYKIYPFDELKVKKPLPKRGGGRNPQPLTVRKYLEGLPWTENKSQFSNQVWKAWEKSKWDVFCTDAAFRRNPLKDYSVIHPKYEKYVEPERLSHCTKLGRTSSTGSWTTFSKEKTLHLFLLACFRFFIFN